MKSVRVILFVMVFGVLFVACVNDNSVDSYEGAVIVLERSEMFTMAQFAIQRVTIDSDGVLYETFYGNGTLSESAYTEFEGDEYESLLNVLEENSFFELNDVYNSEVLVADVGKGRITVSTLNREKSVLIDPYIRESNPLEVVNVMNALNDVIEGANSPFDNGMNE